MATYTTMEGPHHIAIRELDLRTCHPSTMADRVGAVPVLKTSAGEFLPNNPSAYRCCRISFLFFSYSSWLRLDWTLVFLDPSFFACLDPLSLRYLGHHHQGPPVMSFKVKVNLDDKLKR